MKQKSQLTCVQISIVWLSDKVVSLNLYPFSEKFESHCAKWYSSRQKTSFSYCQLWAAVWRKWIHLQFISQKN